MTPAGTAAAGQQVASPGWRRRLGAGIRVAVFPAVAALLLWPCLAGGGVLVPARLLPHFKPWSALPEAAAAGIPWNPLLWDGIAQFYPWRFFAAESIRAGTIPLWNPHQLSGTPFLANSQSAPLYPLHLLLYLPLGIDVAQRMTWLAFIHLALAGWFTGLWTCSLGARRAAAALAGVLFMGSGFVVTWLQLPSAISVACWIPLLLYTAGQLFARRRWSWAGWTGLALGMMLLGGHLQIAFYGLLAAGLQLAWQSAAAMLAGRATTRTARTPGGEGFGRRSLLGAGCAALALGAAVAACQVLPALALARESHRVAPVTEAGYAGYLRLALPSSHLINLFVPGFFGHPLRGSYHGAGNFAEYSAFIGVVGLALALLGALAGWRLGPRAGFPTALAALSLLMALGFAANRLLYFFVPGFNQSGSPNRILVLFCLSLAALAGIGAEVVLRAMETGSVARVCRPALAALILMAAAFIGCDLQAEGPATRAARYLSEHVSGFPSLTATLVERDAALGRGWLLLGIGAGLPFIGLCLMAQGRLPGRWGRGLVCLPALAGVGYDLATFSADYNHLPAPPSLVYPATPLLRQVQQATREERMAAINTDWNLQRAPLATFPPNAAIPYGLMDAQGYDSLFLGRYKTLVNAALGEDSSPVENGNMLFIRRPAAAVCAILGIRWVLTGGEIAGPGPRLAAAGEGCRLYEMPSTPALARLATAVNQPGDERLLAEMVAAARENPARFGATAWLEAGVPAPAAFPGTARWVATSPTRREVRVDAPRGGLLLVDENFERGWTARWRSDGGEARPLPVWRANYTFQAVPLPQGQGTVSLLYAPPAFRVGLFLSLVAAGVLAAAGSRGALNARRSGDIREPPT